MKGFWLIRWYPANQQKVRIFRFRCLFSLNFIVINSFVQLKAAYEELVKIIASKKLSLPYKTFDAATQFSEAAAHTKEPGKSEKTVLLFK